MQDELLLSLKQGDNVRFSTGREDLKAIGTGWFVNIDANLPIPRANIMVTLIESHGPISPVKVGSTIPLFASEIEFVA